MAKTPLTATAEEQRQLKSLDPVTFVDDKGCEVKFCPVEWPDGRLSFGQPYRNGASAYIAQQAFGCLLRRRRWSRTRAETRALRLK
jgi:hypothetical protein